MKYLKQPSPTTKVLSHKILFNCFGWGVMWLPNSVWGEKVGKRHCQQDSAKQVIGLDAVMPALPMLGQSFFLNTYAFEKYYDEV